MSKKVFKVSDATKAYYYQAKISQKSVRKIRTASIMKWIVGMPLQIWRIPWSFILFFRSMGEMVSNIFGTGEYGAPEASFIIVVIAVVLSGISIVKTWYLFVGVITVLFVSYCIFRCIYDIRECYRITYNRDKGFADDYDEWANRFEEPEDDEEAYYYYYRTTGSSNRYDKTYNNGKRAYKTTYEQSKAGYGGSPYSQYEATSSENVFFGLDKAEAKKKYRELMKKYHPDNAETGNADKAREINEMYDEYEELYK